MVFPEDFYEETAGKTAEFTVQIKSISEVSVPEYTDEFVAANTEYDSRKAYEQALREELITSAQQEAASGAGEDALDLAVSNATVNGYPQALYDACYNSTMEEYQQYADMFGVGIDELLKDFMGEENLDSVRGPAIQKKQKRWRLHMNTIPWKNLQRIMERRPFYQCLSGEKLWTFYMNMLIYRKSRKRNIMAKMRRLKGRKLQRHRRWFQRQKKICLLNKF